MTSKLPDNWQPCEVIYPPRSGHARTESEIDRLIRLHLEAKEAAKRKEEEQLRQEQAEAVESFAKKLWNRLPNLGALLDMHPHWRKSGKPAGTFKYLGKTFLVAEEHPVVDTWAIAWIDSRGEANHLRTTREPGGLEAGLIEEMYQHRERSKSLTKR